MPTPPPASPDLPRPPQSGPLVIGLLGGIAAGKSTVAGLFAEQGLQVIDADAKAKEVVRDPGVAAQLQARFGAEIFDAQGELRRQALAAKVFQDRSARQDLEDITHPAIRKLILADLVQAKAQAKVKDQWVLLDVPLLLEGGLIRECHACVFVQVDQGIREARALQRGWDPQELGRREASQAPLAEKRRHCQFQVQNSGDLDQSRLQAREILAALRRWDRRQALGNLD